MSVAVPSPAAEPSRARPNICGRSPRRARAAGGARDTAIAVAVFVGLGLWWMWPLPAHLATMGPDFSRDWSLVEADFNLILWALSWDAHALVTAPWDLFHANAFYPSPTSLAYSDHFLGLTPLFAPVYWATGQPMLAMNVLLIALQPLCALAMYALARRFVRTPAAILAGFLYGFVPWRAASLSHLHMLGVEFLPLIVLFVARWLDRARPRDALLLAGAVTLQGWTSFYLAYAALFVCLAAVPIELWSHRQRLSVVRVAGLALAIAAGFGLVAVLGIPYLEQRRLGLLPAYDAARTGPSAAALLGQLNERSLLDHLGNRSIGWLGYGLVALALVPPVRQRRLGVALGSAVALVGLVAALGPVVPIAGHVVRSPFTLLTALLPGFGATRGTMRYAIVADLGLALLAGIGFERLTARQASSVTWLAAGTAIVVVLATQQPRALLPPVAALHGYEKPTPAARWLAGNGGGRALLELPGGTMADRARRMVQSSFHWLPIVDGYSGYPPNTAVHIGWLARDLPDAASLVAVTDLVDVGWLLVHLDLLPAEQRALWLGTLPEGLEPAQRFGDDLVVRITRRGDPARQARLLSTRETLGGVPIARVQGDCPGGIALTVPPPKRAVVGEVLVLPVRVENRSDKPWPGFAMYPRGLVGVVSCWTSDASSSCGLLPTPLSADVFPGRPLAFPLRLSAPLEAGRYHLQIRLEQANAGPLARCGARDVDIAVDVVPPGTAAATLRP